MFKVHISDHGVEDLRFFYGNEEADDWYFPPKPYTMLEYLWVRENVWGDQVIVDAGCHHGNYSVVFKGCKQIYAFDIEPLCVELTRLNLQLNRMDNSQVHEFGIGRGNSVKQFVEAPDVYKMDIEGWEYDALPGELAAFPSVHTWILELHPGPGDPRDLIALFDDSWEQLLVSREQLAIIPLDTTREWTSHATAIFRRKE